MKNAKISVVTVAVIKALRDEAAQAGDMKMVEVCDRAEEGDTEAAKRCADVIRDQMAQDGL